MVGKLRKLHKVLKKNYQAAERSLTTVPIFWKPFIIYIAAEKYTFNENYIWFSGHYFRVGGTPKNAPIRCNQLTALPLGVLMGQTRRSMKNRPLEMRWERAWVDLACNETGVGEWMELYWLFVCGNICARNTADKRNGMTAWIVEWSDSATSAVGCWGGWNERNVMKWRLDGKWRRNGVHRNVMREVNEPTASTWK